jgi:hypothetical protein
MRPALLAGSHDASRPGSAVPPRAGAREGGAGVLAAPRGMVEVAAACLALKTYGDGLHGHAAPMRA